MSPATRAWAVALVAWTLPLGAVSCAHVEGTAELHDHAPPGDRLLLQNTSRHTICYVTLGAAGEDLRRAPDRLAADETLPPGAQHAFDVEDGAHRLRLMDCNRRLLLEREVVVTPAGLTLTFRDP